MSTLKARVTKLEAQSHAENHPARSIVLQGGKATDEELDAFLRRQGIEPTPADQIVYLTTFYETRDGGTEVGGTLTLLSTTPLKGGKLLARTA